MFLHMTLKQDTDIVTPLVKIVEYFNTSCSSLSPQDRSVEGGLAGKKGENWGRGQSRGMNGTWQGKGEQAEEGETAR